MFQRLKRKINLIISIALSLVILSTSILAYTMLKSIIYNHYKLLVTQCIEQSNKNARLYMYLIEEETNYFAADSSLVHFLKQGKFDSRIIAILDGLKNMNLNILGVSVYSQNNMAYTSNNVSNAPPLQWILDNEIPPDFIKDPNQQSGWMLRYKFMDQSYYFSYKKGKTGVLSLLHKIMDFNGNLIGIMIVDTDVDALNRFYQNELSEYFDLHGSYLITESERALAKQTPSKAERKKVKRLTMNSDNKKSDDGNKGNSGIRIFQQNGKDLIAVSSIPSSSGNIVVHVLMDPLNSKLSGLRTWLILLSVLLILFSIGISGALTESIINPLNHLYRKMKSPLPDTDL